MFISLRVRRPHADRKHYPGIVGNLAALRLDEQKPTSRVTACLSLQPSKANRTTGEDGGRKCLDSCGLGLKEEQERQRIVQISTLLRPILGVMGPSYWLGLN